MTLFWPAGSGDSLAIRGARVIDQAQGIDGAFDVVIDNGVIVGIEPATEAARGLVLAPAFIDPHVHLRVPGREDEETIASGTAAAAAGGYCAILAMPNTDPVVDSVAVLGALIELARTEAAVPTGFMAAISKGLEGEELTEMAELARLGAAGFTDDGHPVVSGRPHATGTAIQRRHGEDAGTARGGANALARRSDERGACIGSTRLRRLALGGGGGDDRAGLHSCCIRATISAYNASLGQ